MSLDGALPNPHHPIAGLGQVGVLRFVELHAAALSGIRLREPRRVAVPVVPVELHHEASRWKQGILDMFAGTGVTGEAALLEGFGAVLIEREAEHVADIRRRLGRARGDDAPLFAESAA